MSNQNFDPTLINLLEKEVIKEEWRKKLRIKGIVTKKRVTRKGSFMFTIKTRKSEYDVVVPEYKKMEFELAKNINERDFIRVVGDKSMNVVFCDRIEKLNKPIKYNEKQSKLVVH